MTTMIASVAIFYVVLALAGTLFGNTAATYSRSLVNPTKLQRVHLFMLDAIMTAWFYLVYVPASWIVEFHDQP
jgi:hypothetical protein